MIGSVTISFPVFWEYSFKAALKIAWNCKDDAFNGGFEDIGLVESQVSERVGAVRCTVYVPKGCTCLHCPKYNTISQEIKATGVFTRQGGQMRVNVDSA